MAGPGSCGGMPSAGGTASWGGTRSVTSGYGGTGALGGGGTGAFGGGVSVMEPPIGG
jgi:hypothetical protein